MMKRIKRISEEQENPGMYFDCDYHGGYGSGIYFI